jgi:hypothetical protein
MRFERLGLLFEYPDDWSVEVDASQPQHPAVTIVTPGGGFWTVSRHPPDTDQHALADTIVTQMQREYQDIDIEPATEKIDGRELPGHDFNFYCLDLTNTATSRTIAAAGAVHLVFCQAEDREWNRMAPVFAAMTTSLVRGLEYP